MTDRFERFHPLTTFIYYGGALTFLILLLHPVFLSSAFFIIIMTHFLKNKGSSLAPWLWFMLTSGFLLLLFNPLFNERGRHVLFIVFQHRFTLEAFIYGGMSALSIMGIIALFVSYNEVMTPNKILFLFSKLLPQFAVLLMLTLRFIPLMKRRTEEIIAIQTSKGVSAVNGPLRKRLAAGLLFIQALLVHSLEEAIQTAESMKARGYGSGTRSAYEYFRFKKKDGLAAFWIVGLIAVISFFRYHGAGYLTVYPRLEGWRLTTDEFYLLVLYCLYFSFPLLVNIGGAIQWRTSN